MKQFTVPEMTFKDHRQYHPSLDCLDILSETCKFNLFSDKIAKMTLKIDQGHLRRNNSIGHISFC